MNLWIEPPEYGIIIGILINIPVGLLAFRKEWLQKGAVLEAFTVSLLIFIADFVFWVLLLGFFISSSVLTKWKESAKKKFANKFEKKGKRDEYQVLANGLAATVMAILFLLTDEYWFVLGYVACTASVTGDTWATEIGVFSKNEPRWILNTKKRVPKGTSGGVSALGTAAALMATLFIFGIYGSLSMIGLSSKNPSTTELYLAFTAAIIGFLGVIFDSLLGATLQGYYECKKCLLTTEKPIHCGEGTRLIRGTKVINNDIVNFTSSMGAGVLAVVIGLIFV